MSRAYSANELQAIIDETWKRAFQVARATHPDAPQPAPPSVFEVVDHPYHGSDAKGQHKRPWLNDPRGQRGLVVSSSVLGDAVAVDHAAIGDKCELKWHRGDLKGTIRVVETFVGGEEAHNVIICKNCAETLGVREGGTLPDSVTVEKALTQSRT